MKLPVFSRVRNRLALLGGLAGAAAVPAHAQRLAPDSSKIYTFVARMPHETLA